MHRELKLQILFAAGHKSNSRLERYKVREKAEQLCRDLLPSVGRAGAGQRPEKEDQNRGVEQQR